jgi:hypothetical protein
MLGSYTWVCSICGQGFTRKTSARRHNGNLHLEQANIVRPFDYVFGRVSGHFPTLIQYYTELRERNRAYSRGQNLLRLHTKVRIHLIGETSRKDK